LKEVNSVSENKTAFVVKKDIDNKIATIHLYSFIKEKVTTTQILAGHKIQKTNINFISRAGTLKKVGEFFVAQKPQKKSMPPSDFSNLLKTLQNKTSKS
jgi:hypothetical protein